VGTELSIAYHDREWGVPIRDDRAVRVPDSRRRPGGFELGDDFKEAQNYRAAFDNFEPASSPGTNHERLRSCSGRRHHPQSTEDQFGIENAKAFFEIQKEFAALRIRLAIRKRDERSSANAAQQ